MPVILRWFLRLGPTNPIAVRLVQNGSRRLRHLYIRSAYLAALILVLLWSLLLIPSGNPSYRELAAAGASTFTTVAYMQIGLICLLAPVFMAGAIRQEASPRTWDILLTTPMSPMEIVLGNLLGRLFFMLALLASGLPLFALTQYFGGVPGSSIFASYGIAAGAATLVGTIAVALSVSRLVGQRAVFTFYVAVVSYLGVTVAVDYWLRSVGAGAGPGGRGVTWLTAINPFLALQALLNPTGYPRAEPIPGGGVLRSWLLESPVTTWCVGSTLLSLLLIVASAITVRAGGLTGVAASRVRARRRKLGPATEDADGTTYRAPRPVWANPIAWREASARNATFGRIAARWSFIALGGLFGVLLVVLFHAGKMTGDEFQLSILATVWGEIAVSTLVALNMAATAVSREREDGTLDLLLTTPITPGQYLSGKLRGLVAYVLPLLAVPVGTLLIAGAYVLAGGFGRVGGVEVSRTVGTIAIKVPAVLPEAGLIVAIVLVPFIAFCVMIGLQWSLKSKGTLSSVMATVGVVGAVSAVVGLCGYKSGNSLAILGPALAAMSPASLVYSVVDPAFAAEATVNNDGSDMPVARVALFIGAVVAAAIYLLVVYGVHANMVRTFDVTVRRLAGTS